MIIIRKVRNEERYCVKAKLNPYIFVYVSSREQAEDLKNSWLRDSKEIRLFEVGTHIQPFMEKMETHADEIKSDIFESPNHQRAPPLENPDRILPSSYQGAKPLKRNCREPRQPKGLNPDRIHRKTTAE